MKLVLKMRLRRRSQSIDSIDVDVWVVITQREGWFGCVALAFARHWFHV